MRRLSWKGLIELMGTMNYFHQQILSHIKIANDCMKECYDINKAADHYVAGDLLALQSPESVKSLSLAAKAWQGPHMVEKKINVVVYRNSKTILRDEMTLNKGGHSVVNYHPASSLG